MSFIENLYAIFLQHPSICTDSRALRAGDLFFALKGENFNGNHFAQQALAQGAAYAIVDETNEPASARVLQVKDVLRCLQELAEYHRKQFRIPFIAITGSNGKTTTKELIHAVLATRFKTYTTKGNLNNHIGIPLTLLAVGKDAEMAVVEMGANHQKEIEGYCVYARPDFGLITNVGKAHLEGFGGEAGIKKGKGELFDYLRNNQGTAFVMWDYDYLRDMSHGIAEILRYGTTDAEVEGAISRSHPYLSVSINKGLHPFIIHTRLTGDYNLPNVLAAVAVGNYFGVSAENIKSGIESYEPSNNRSQLIKSGSNQIILDAYNANPSSMKAAIENIAGFDVPDKVLVLGGMAELGQESLDEHKNIVSLIELFPWTEVLLVGGDFLRIKHPFLSFENALAASAWLKEKQFENTLFLVKGSRSMQMEKIIPAITAG